MYTLGVRFYGLGVRLAALFGSDKAKLWLQGRKGMKGELSDLKQLILDKGMIDRVIWVHCASLGEFEMGLPLMEALKEKHPDHFLLVTFFSPSGYTVRRDHPIADKVMYLPLDTPAWASRFVDAARPSIGILVKYEVWLNHVEAALAAGTRMYLVSAVFNARQRFFKPWGRRFASVLRRFNEVFVQDAGSARLLEGISVEAEVAGDTRYDRVLQTARKADPPVDIAAFKGNASLWVIGSNWADDDRVLLPVLHALDKDLQVVIAPHEVDAKRIDTLHSRLQGLDVKRYSQWDGRPFHGVLILDTIGLLSRVYALADVSYVGGGFHGALHNVLEPAVFGHPVIFGPEHSRFPEAQELIDAGMAMSISTSNGSQHALEWALGMDPQECRAKSQALFARHEGATRRIAIALEDSMQATRT